MPLISPLMPVPQQCRQYLQNIMSMQNVSSKCKTNNEHIYQKICLNSVISDITRQLVSITAETLTGSELRMQSE